VRQIKALIVGLAFAVVLVAQGFTIAAFMSGKVMADKVAMIAWSDAQAAVVLLGGGILATFVLMVAMFRRRREPSSPAVSVERAKAGNRGQELQVWCPECGTRVAPDTRYCTQCGYGLSPRDESTSLERV
jgi:ribosomal protein L37E